MRGMVDELVERRGLGTLPTAPAATAAAMCGPSVVPVIARTSLFVGHLSRLVTEAARSP